MPTPLSVVNAGRRISGPLRQVSPPRRAGLASDPHFYVPPALDPAGRPGDLVRAERFDAYVVPALRLRAEAWRILYRSTSATGTPTIVSGTVLLPPARGDHPVPLVGYAIGTHGIGDHAAPSRLLARGLDYEAIPIASVLGRGWAVAISDYEGLGTPGDHTYLVGHGLGPNVLDAMRAARALCPDRLPADGVAAVVGYSEGGAAAGWAAQLQPTYAPDIPLAAVVAGAAPADPGACARRLDGSLFSFFMFYGAIGYAAAYPELDIDPYLTPSGRRAITMLRNSSIIEAAVRGPHFARADHFTDPNVLELPEWRARLDENRLGAIAPSAPVLLHHARRDQIVPFTESVGLADEWRAIGADVRLYVTRGGFDHVTGLLAALPVALDWLGRRIARAERELEAPVVALRAA